MDKLPEAPPGFSVEDCGYGWEITEPDSGQFIARIRRASLRGGGGAVEFGSGPIPVTVVRYTLELYTALCSDVPPVNEQRVQNALQALREACAVRDAAALALSPIQKARQEASAKYTAALRAVENALEAAYVAGATEEELEGCV